MKRRFEFRPGIACYLTVSELGSFPQFDRVDFIWHSREKGALSSLRNRPLADFGWPPAVVAEINKHFGTVFGLAHEDWKEQGPSPRAVYTDNLKPWTIEVEEGEPA